MLPALAFLLLAGLNGLLWNWAEARRATNEEHIFRGRAELLVHDIQDQVENNADALRALRGYVQAEGTPSPGGWHAFLDSLSARKRYPGIRSFQYSQRVDATARGAFDRQAAEQGRPAIWDIQNGRGAPPREAGTYFPILLAEPPDPAILSFDVSSRETTRLSAQVPAAESSTLALGQPFKLIQAPGVWVLPMVAPIYAGTPHPVSPEERRSGLRGYITLLMNPDELFAGLGDADLLDYAIYDGKEETPSGLIFSRGNIGAGSWLVHHQSVEILGHTWTVEVRGTAWWSRLGRQDSWRAAGSGIIASLGILAAIIALALARERALVLVDRMTLGLREANRALVDLATTDPLTGLLNRRAMDVRLAEEEARAFRDATPLAVICVDVDFFKHVNDKYGHAMGDAVLRNLGRMLREATRLTDHSARMGGEEFLLVCPNTDAEGAVVLAEQLRNRFETTDHQDGDTRIRVTASFGVAVMGPDPRPDAARLLRRADLALYLAKEAGRNRVELWTPPVVRPEA
jgi:diguanylate cyclase (GGDEF)-like protein